MLAKLTTLFPHPPDGAAQAQAARAAQLLHATGAQGHRRRLHWRDIRWVFDGGLQVRPILTIGVCSAAPHPPHVSEEYMTEEERRRKEERWVSKATDKLDRQLLTPASDTP